MYKHFIKRLIDIILSFVGMQAGFKEVNKYITDDGYEEVLMELRRGLEF